MSKNLPTAYGNAAHGWHSSRRADESDMTERSVQSPAQGQRSVQATDEVEPRY